MSTKSEARDVLAHAVDWEALGGIAGAYRALVILTVVEALDDAGMLTEPRTVLPALWHWDGTEHVLPRTNATRNPRRGFRWLRRR